VLRKRSSQLQKIEGCAYVSSNSSRPGKVRGWDGEHPGLTGWNLINYTRIENVPKVRKKTFVLYYVAVIVQLLGGQNRYALVWAIMINLPELPINDNARNDTYIASTGVRLYQCIPRAACHIKKTKRETSDASNSQLNQASWNRTFLTFSSENQLNVHNYLSIQFCDFPWSHDLDQGFPTWGTFNVSNRREKYIYIAFISKYLYIYQWIIFSKILMCFYCYILDIYE